jgi:hypothetical protein
MPVSPKVTSSELNGVIAKRAIAACSPAPSAKNAGTMSPSVSQRIDAHRRQLVAQVRRQEGEREVRQVDQPQQPPRQAQPRPSRP